MYGIHLTICPKYHIISNTDEVGGHFALFKMYDGSISNLF